MKNSHYNAIASAYDTLKKLDMSGMTPSQGIDVGIVLGNLAFVLDQVKIESMKETFSNCCGVPMDCDMHLCPACKEGCARVNENNEEVE